MKLDTMCADQTPAILDDVEQSLRLLTEFGRAVVGPAARSIRECILLRAAVRGWQVVHYTEFAKWAESKANTDVNADLVWLSLDPLFAPERLGSSAKAVRFTRVATNEGWRIDSVLSDHVEKAVDSKKVGVLDDVASSGDTLRYLEDLITRAGGTLSRVLLAASTAPAHASINRQGTGPIWEQYLAGNHSAIHLRDACSYLPFAGRRAFDKLPIATGNGVVDARVPVMIFKGGAWQQLAQDRAVQLAVLGAQQELVSRFSAALGYSATVRDIPRLGRGVAVSLLPDQSVTEASTLESLLRR